MWSPPPPAAWRRLSWRARLLDRPPPATFRKETAIGALGCYVSDRSVGNFQPMNINFGIIEPAGLSGEGQGQ